MADTDLFITIDSATPRKSKKNYGYVLQCKIKDKPYTREGFGSITGTYHQATLEALLKALSRFKKSTTIKIHCEDEFILNMIRQNLQKWYDHNFVNTKGKPVANAEEWRQIYEKIKTHKILAEPGKHEYTNWLLEEIKKGEEDGKG